MINKPEMTPEQVEKYAIRVALGNNGGKWLEVDGKQHYTDKQKEHWRRFIRDLSLDIWKDAYDAGYERGLKDADQA